MMIVLDEGMARKIVSEIRWNGSACLLAVDADENVWCRSVDDVEKGRVGRFLGNAMSHAEQVVDANENYRADVAVLVQRMRRDEDDRLNDIADEREGSVTVNVDLKDL